MSISVSLKRVGALLAAIAFVFSAFAVTKASAATCPGTFTLNHKVGQSGGEVMWIQQFLNGNGYTISLSGAGSPGMESSYFGAKTKAAVMAFQRANGVSPVSGYWGPLTRATANALCVSGPSTGPTTPSTGNATVSAAAQPGNSLAPASAARVPFTKFTVTAGATPVTLNSVTVERGGLASDDAFASIVLLDQNGSTIGIEKVLGSTHQANIGSPVVIPAGASQTFTVAANMASSTSASAGQVAVFSVVAINTNGTVAGSLPITGAQHTVNATLSLGSATVARGPLDPGVSLTKEIGTTNYTFSSLKVTSGSTEKVRVWGIRFNQSGSASSTDISNVKVLVDGSEYIPTVSTDGKYYDVNFPGGIVIDKGLQKEFTIKGDIVSGSGRTVKFDLYKITDVKVTGETYGYGITPGVTSPVTTNTPSYSASTVTVNAGTFNSVSKSNLAPAANIGTQKADELLGAFTVDIKGESVQVQTMPVTITLSANYGTGSAVTREITNVKLVDQNGAVIAGPVDYSTTSAVALLAKNFTGLTFPTGATTVYVKGQLGSGFATNDTVVVSTSASGWTGVTGSTSGNTISTASLATATANTMTVKGAALAVKNQPQPAARGLVPGSVKQQFAEIALDASGSGDDIRVTSTTLTNTVAGGAAVGDIDNVEIYADLNSSNNTDVRYGKYETRVKAAEQFSATTLSMVFDTPVTVPKNSTVNLGVFADLNAAAATAALGTNTYTIKVNSASDVAATSAASGASVTPTLSAGGQAMSSVTGGALTIGLSASTPSASLLRDDTANEQTLSVLKLTTDKVEDINVDEITITNAGLAAAVSKYVLYKGTTKLAEASGGAGTATFYLAPVLNISVDSNVELTVKAILNNIDGTTVVNGSTITASIAAATDVKAKSASSGTSIVPSGTATGSTHKMAETVPTFVAKVLPSTTLGINSSYLAGKFSVTATGDKDVVLGTGTVLKVQYNANNATVGSLTLKDATTGNTVGTITGSASGADAAVVWHATNTFTVAAGTTKDLDVYADVSAFPTPTSSSSLYVKLAGVAANLNYGVNNLSTLSGTVGDLVFKNDIYGTTSSK